MQIDRAQILKAAASLGGLGGGANDTPRILAALCNPQVQAREVAGLLGREPALYAKVLRVANSPYYGQARSISTLERAVVVLGLDAVRGIAAAACLDRTAVRNNQPTLIDIGALIAHSLATAAAAESLARLRHPGLAAQAFITGLLHNLGIVVQMSLDAAGMKSMIALRQAADERDMRTLECEQTIVGHETCIAMIFEAWNLPEALIAAVHDHHDPAAASPDHRDLTACINLGATLGLASGHTFTLEPAPIPCNAFAMSCLGVAPPQLDEIARELPRRVEVLKKALFDR